MPGPTVNLDPRTVSHGSFYLGAYTKRPHLNSTFDQIDNSVYSIQKAPL